MDPNKYFENVLKKTDILKSPEKRLSTFGETRINYFFLSEIDGFKDRSRLREGLVIAEKPKLITPELLRERFEGFGEEQSQFGKWISETYGDLFRGLEYHFKNETSSIHIEHTPLKVLADEIEKRLNEDDLRHSAIIKGPDETWQISLMKFIVDECISSFTQNIKDLGEHGFFDSPKDILKGRKKIIEELFEKAKNDHSYTSLLGKKLNEFGLFKEYEEDFFKLIRR